MFGIAFTTDQVKDLEIVPGEWGIDDLEELDTECYSLIECNNVLPQFNCESSRLYLVGIRLDDAPIEFLLEKVSGVKEELKAFCKACNLEYREPVISSYIDVE